MLILKIFNLAGKIIVVPYENLLLQYVDMKLSFEGW